MTTTRAQQWVFIALLVCGAAALLACGEKEIDAGNTEIEVERDGDVDVEREGKLERDLEQAGEEAQRGAERGARRLGEGINRAGESVERGLEKGARNIERSLDEARRDIEPIARDVLDDAAISARVKARLMADPDVNAFYIDVDTIDGRVTLNGKVEEAFQRDEAARLAQRTEGVREVVNMIRVVGEG
jgi:osmotically-inducible protein OsmY